MKTKTHGRAPQGFSIKGPWSSGKKKQDRILFHVPKYADGIDLIRESENDLMAMAEKHAGDRVALCKAVRDFLNERGTTKWTFKTNFHCDLHDEVVFMPVLATKSKISSSDENMSFVDLLLVVPPSTVWKSHSANYGNMYFKTATEADHERLAEIFSRVNDSLMEESTWDGLLKEANEHDRELLIEACVAAWSQIYNRSRGNEFNLTSVVKPYLKIQNVE